MAFAAELQAALTAAQKARLVNRPSQLPNYKYVSKAIYSNLHKALTDPPGADPCHALLDAARAIDSTVHGTLTCPGPPPAAGRS